MTDESQGKKHLADVIGNVSEPTRPVRDENLRAAPRKRQLQENN